MNSIGIFDSGVGGLGIFNKIKKLLPKENIIYLADSKNCPYGKKSIQQIKQICLDNTKFLIDKGAKIVVMACNTGSTIALEYVRNNLNQIQPRRLDFQVPIVGVVPVVKTAAKETKNNRIGILATKATIESDYLQALVTKFCPNMDITYQACGELVEMVEKSKIDINKLEKCLKPLINAKVDVVALGCTHFPFARYEIEQILGPNIKVLDSNGAVARQVQRVLTNNSQLSTFNKKPVYKFYTSGDAKRFKKQIQFLINMTTRVDIISN